MLKKLHNKLVFLRRIKILSRELSAFIKGDIKTILDIGCGDGTISMLIQDKNPQLQIFGVDIMGRPTCSIPFRIYNGEYIPFDDNSFDVCMLVDVLHHLTDIKFLLAEARRVSNNYILIKDHLYKNSVDFKTLKFMDDVGNKPHDVVLEYNYLKEEEWKSIFEELGLAIIQYKTSIPIYSFPFNVVFGRKLHFICMLKLVK